MVGATLCNIAVPLTKPDPCRVPLILRPVDLQPVREHEARPVVVRGGADGGEKRGVARVHGRIVASGPHGPEQAVVILSRRPGLERDGEPVPLQ